MPYSPDKLYELVFLELIPYYLAIDFCLHPHEVVRPETKLDPTHSIVLPHLHLHINNDFPYLLEPVLLITVK